MLLLLRNSKHNDKTWGLPGGNSDKGERILDTAKREATEEMGSMPSCDVLGQILTRCTQSTAAYVFWTVEQARPLSRHCSPADGLNAVSLLKTCVAGGANSSRSTIRWWCARWMQLHAQPSSRS